MEPSRWCHSGRTVSAAGTFHTWRDVRHEPANRSQADVDYPQVAHRPVSCRLLILTVSNGLQFSLRHPHIHLMAHWQISITRQPPKTKAELRQMLAEAVRNTQARADHGPKRLPKAKKIAAAASID